MSQTITTVTTYNKIDDKTIEITDTTTTVDVVTRGQNLQFLADLRDGKQAELDNYVTMRQKEINAITDAINQARALGISEVTPILEG